MSEVLNDVPAEQEETVVEAPKQEVDYKAMYEKANADLQAVARKKDQLLDEKKKVSQNADDTKKSLEQQLNELREGIKNEKIENNALKIAGELAEGHNIKLLARFIQEDLKNMMNEEGALSAEGLLTVKQQFLENEMYSSLLKGKKSAGGGATGNIAAKAVVNEVSRADFDKMDHTARSKFFANGGKLI